MPDRRLYTIPQLYRLRPPRPRASPPPRSPTLAPPNRTISRSPSPSPRPSPTLSPVLRASSPLLPPPGFSAAPSNHVVPPPSQTRQPKDRRIARGPDLTLNFATRIAYARARPPQPDPLRDRALTSEIDRLFAASVLQPTSREELPGTPISLVPTADPHLEQVTNILPPPTSASNAPKNGNGLLTKAPLSALKTAASTTPPAQSVPTSTSPTQTSHTAPQSALMSAESMLLQADQSETEENAFDALARRLAEDAARAKAARAAASAEAAGPSGNRAAQGGSDVDALARWFGAVSTSASDPSGGAQDNEKSLSGMDTGGHRVMQHDNAPSDSLPASVLTYFASVQALARRNEGPLFDDDNGIVLGRTVAGNEADVVSGKELRGRYETPPPHSLQQSGQQAQAEPVAIADPLAIALGRSSYAADLTASAADVQG